MEGYTQESLIGRINLEKYETTPSLMMEIFLINEGEDFWLIISVDLWAKTAMIPKIKAIAKNGIFSIRDFRSNFR